MDIQTEKRIYEAKACIDRGWSLIPLSGKVPTISGWRTAPKTTQNQAVSYAIAGNFGILTGKISNIFCLDVDIKNGALGEQSLSALELDLKDVPMVRTGSGGSHYYFSYDECGLSITAGELGSGLDTRGEGGYVVAPSSFCGNIYQWEVPIKGNLQAIPKKIIDLMKSPPTPLNEAPEADGGIPVGRRELTLFKKACKLQRIFTDQEIVFEALFEFSKNHFKKPFSEKEVRDKVVSSLKAKEKSDADQSQYDLLIEEKNQRYTYIFKPEGIYDNKIQSLISVKDFKTNYCNVPVFTTDGKTDLGLAWVQSAQRKQKQTVTWKPWKEDFPDMVNTWTGLGVEPVEGDIEPYWDLVKHNFRKPEDIEWFWKWLAYPLQHPGTKLYTAVMLKVSVQGVGKTEIGAIMGEIYGNNYCPVDSETFSTQWNDHLTRKQFIQCDEAIEPKEARSQAGKLKNYITNRKLTVNQRYVDSWVTDNFANFYFTSNHANPIFIEKGDRRFYVIEASDELLSDEFWAKFKSWRLNGGASHLLYFLLNAVPLEDFNPDAPAPMTLAKKDMIEINQSDFDKWLLEEMESYPKDIITITRVMEMWKDHNVEDKIFKQFTASHFSIKMKELVGAKKYDGQIKVEGNPLRLWSIRNHKKWSESTPTEWRAEMLGRTEK